jgi:hypothetical protein
MKYQILDLSIFAKREKISISRIRKLLDSDRYKEQMARRYSLAALDALSVWSLLLLMLSISHASPRRSVQTLPPAH